MEAVIFLPFAAVLGGIVERYSERPAAAGTRRRGSRGSLRRSPDIPARCPSCWRRLPYIKTVSSNSARRSAVLHIQGEAAVLHPGELQQLLHHGGQAPGLAEDDEHAPAGLHRVDVVAAERSVSPQPVMAVRGVRSSWDTEETNSACIFSVWAILADISLMVSASSPISSSRCFWICDAVGPGGNALGCGGDLRHRGDEWSG